MKTLSKNKLFTLLFAGFMLLCTLLGIVATVPRSAKADVNKEGIEELPDFTGYVEKELEVGDVVTGCWLRLEVDGCNEEGLGSYAGQITFNETAVCSISIEGWQAYYYSGINELETMHDLFIRYYDDEIDQYYIYIDEDANLSGDGFKDDLINELLGTTHVDTKGFTVKGIEIVEAYCTKGPHEVKVYKLTDPNTEGTDQLPDNAEPDPNPVDPEQPTIGEKIDEIGNNVSEWLSDNAGIAVGGGSVITIAGVIIVIMLLKKRRR